MEESIEKLREMRLNGIIQGIKEQINKVNYSELSFEERIAHIVDTEYFLRSNRKISQNIKQAKLHQYVSLEQIDYEQPRGLNKSQIRQLSSCQWIESKHNLIILGPTGIGKTFLACSFGHKACRLDKKVLYTKMSILNSDLSIAKADGSYGSLLQKLSKLNLLIIDEWMREPLSAPEARNLLEVLDSRYLHGSHLFVSQIPVEEWHSQIDNSTLADAILDRLVHNSIRINLKGESMRKILNKVENNTIC